jgi:hypothetical protein
VNPKSFSINLYTILVVQEVNMKKLALTLTLSLTVILLEPAFSEAQPTNMTPTSPFWITDADVNASDCDEHFDNLLKQQQLTHKEAVFRKAVCRFHHPSLQSDGVEIEKTVTLLRELQTQGLWAAQQTLAAFMEGLLQCRQAKLAINRLAQLDSKTLANPKSPPLATVDLCAARRGAIASFADINWAYARFDYQAKSSNNISDLLDEMASCYSSEDADNDNIVDGPLNPAFNEVCQILRLPQPRIAAIIKHEADNVIQEQFGAKSPIAKIFLENKQLAESYTQSATQAVRDLKPDSDTVVTVYDKLNTHFNNQVDKLLTLLVDDYKMAYVVGKSILDKYAQWQRGFLQLGNQDLSLDLIGASDQYGKQGLEGRVQAQIKQIEALIKQAETIPANIVKGQNKDSDTRNRIRQLCQIYYCEFGRAGPLRYEVLKQACESDDMRTKPLCNIDEIDVEDSDNRYDVYQLCEQVGKKDSGVQGEPCTRIRLRSTRRTLYENKAPEYKANLVRE